MTRKTYCGNLLWQSSLTLLAPDGSLAALRGFLDCYEGSEECGMVCADGVHEKGTVDGTKFIAAAQKLGKSVK